MRWLLCLLGFHLDVKRYERYGFGSKQFIGWEYRCYDCKRTWTSMT